MKYDHMVKSNGKYYKAGEELPEYEGTAGEKTNLPFSDHDIEFETKSNGKRYTKTEISHMKTEDLQSLAEKEGIQNAYGTSGSELKKILSEHFGL